MWFVFVAWLIVPSQDAKLYLDVCALETSSKDAKETDFTYCSFLVREIHYIMQLQDVQS